MPRIIPEERYFSMPSVDVGAEVRRNRALNCCPWVRSLTHSPVAVIHSPAEIIAAWPTTVTRSRCPRAFARRTQKPFSALWNVTRSTRPARTSWVEGATCGFMHATRPFPKGARRGEYCQRGPAGDRQTLLLWVIFNDLGPGRALPVNPNDRKYRARSGASASAMSAVFAMSATSPVYLRVGKKIAASNRR
jgi:hypothetical protein